MTDTCRYKFLVIDDEHLLAIDNLERTVNQALKHPEPVLRMDAPWDTDDDVFDFASVVYDQGDGLFKMWYNVYTAPNGDEFRFNCPSKLAYAYSEDGIHWERPKLDLTPHFGASRTNFITPGMGGFFASVILDPSDPPERRFKMLFCADSGYGDGSETAWAGFHYPMCLAYSGDGIHWDRPVHVNPVLRGVSDGPCTLYYDEDRRKYVLLSRRVPNLPRDISQYDSSDLVNWEDTGRVLVAGDEHDSADMYNLHAISAFRYEDYYLAMLNTFYCLPESESYEVFNKPPADHPNKRFGIMDLQLAYSRDGRHWVRPADRSPVVPAGEPGSCDGGFIYPANNPIVRDGETWIYYSGRFGRHNDWDLRGRPVKCLPRDESFCMLARMPEDHWVSLDAGGEEGSFTCKPWGPPHEVFVNADAAGGEITAELVTPYGEPVPGCTRADCIPITANGKDQAIRWKGVPHPWELHADYLGGVLVRFYLKKAKLYSYSFTLPDPTGQLERDRLNARWCDHIRHRSGSWDRASTEPAGGVPPHPTSRI